MSEQEYLLLNHFVGSQACTFYKKKDEKGYKKAECNQLTGCDEDICERMISRLYFDLEDFDDTLPEDVEDFLFCEEYNKDHPYYDEFERLSKIYDVMDIPTYLKSIKIYEWAVDCFISPYTKIGRKRLEREFNHLCSM